MKKIEGLTYMTFLIESWKAKPLYVPKKHRLPLVSKPHAPLKNRLGPIDSAFWKE
jgi:hypothetical protein